MVSLGPLYYSTTTSTTRGRIRPGLGTSQVMLSLLVLFNDYEELEGLILEGSRGAAKTPHHQRPCSFRLVPSSK